MRALHGELLLTAWEQCRVRTDPERALLLLELATPEQPSSSLSIMPLAERNALLLGLRAITFGRRMEGFAACLECNAPLEFSMDADELARGIRMRMAETREQPEQLSMRPANTADLLACLDAQDDEQARRILLARTLDLEEIDTAEVPPAWIEQFDALNTPAEVRIELWCPTCSSRFLLDLEIGNFLFREITFAARRLMAEIHTLASSYGWSEQVIVAMSSTRRAAYLEMLNA